MPEILIVPTGTANIASVAAAFRRLGAAVRVAERGREIQHASHVMLPGVGAFGAAMARLRGNGFVDRLADRIRADRLDHRHVLGVGDEVCAHPARVAERGLGVVPGTVGRFTGEVRVPQFGWNQVEAGEGCALLESGWAYFANSYRATAAPGWQVATAEHGGRFVAAIERGNVVGCQFHPELSGAYGAALLSRFLELT